jgi:hypothetical protein
MPFWPSCLISCWRITSRSQGVRYGWFQQRILYYIPTSSLLEAQHVGWEARLISRYKSLITCDDQDTLNLPTYLHESWTDNRVEEHDWRESEAQQDVQLNALIRPPKALRLCEDTNHLIGIHTHRPLYCWSAFQMLLVTRLKYPKITSNTGL